MRAFPDDWNHRPLPRGVHRDASQRRYAVTLSCHGVRHYLGSTKSQYTAAQLYDAAVYCLCPKLPGQLKPNNPETFKLADTHCLHAGRWNKLYAALPYLRPDDRLLTESELRAERLAEPGPVEFDADCHSLVEWLKRVAGECGAHRARLDAVSRRHGMESDQRDTLLSLAQSTLSLQRDYQATADFFSV